MGPAGLPTEQFTFTLAGNFFHLANFFNRLQNFVISRENTLLISGRLMTINAINLSPGANGFPQTTASVSATTYIVPATQGPLGGATPAGPATAAADPGAVLRILDHAARRGDRPRPMSVLSNMIKELRERKLWPIAIGLIVALVAVPVLLSKKAPTNLVVPQPTGGLPYSTGTSLPAISVKTAPGASKLAGRGRDPFTPQHVATTATTVSTTPTTTATPAPSAGTAGTTPTSSGGGSSSVTPVDDFARACSRAGADHACPDHAASPRPSPRRAV